MSLVSVTSSSGRTLMVRGEPGLSMKRLVAGDRPALMVTSVSGCRASSFS